MTDAPEHSYPDTKKLIERLRAGSKINSGNLMAGRLAMREAADLIERGFPPAQQTLDRNGKLCNNSLARREEAGKAGAELVERSSSELYHRPSANLVPSRDSERKQQEPELKPGADKSEKGASPRSADELPTNASDLRAILSLADRCDRLRAGNYTHGSLTGALRDCASMLRALSLPSTTNPAQGAGDCGDEEQPDCTTPREHELYFALMGLASAVMARRREWDNWVQGGVKVAPIVRKALRLDGPLLPSTEGRCPDCPARYLNGGCSNCDGGE